MPADFFQLILAFWRQTMETDNTLFEFCWNCAEQSLELNLFIFFSFCHSREIDNGFHCDIIYQVIVFLVFRVNSNCYMTFKAWLWLDIHLSDERRGHLFLRMVGNQKYDQIFLENFHLIFSVLWKQADDSTENLSQPNREGSKQQNIRIVWVVQMARHCTEDTSEKNQLLETDWFRLALSYCQLLGSMSREVKTKQKRFDENPLVSPEANKAPTQFLFDVSVGAQFLTLSKKPYLSRWRPDQTIGPISFHEKERRQIDFSGSPVQKRAVSCDIISGLWRYRGSRFDFFLFYCAQGWTPGKVQLQKHKRSYERVTRLLTRVIVEIIQKSFGKHSEDELIFGVYKWWLMQIGFDSWPVTLDFSQQNTGRGNNL